MGSVRRISLISAGVVGKHRKTKSGGGGCIGVGGGGGSPVCIPPVPTLLPSALSCASQVLLKIPSSTNTVKVLLHPIPQLSIFEEHLLFLFLMVVATLTVDCLPPLLLLHLSDLIQVPAIPVLHPYHHLWKAAHESYQNLNLNQVNQKNLLRMAV
jgi:hypothetical protein